jgi:hypothetical protein
MLCSHLRNLHDHHADIVNIRGTVVVYLLYMKLKYILSNISLNIKLIFNTDIRYKVISIFH